MTTEGLQRQHTDPAPPAALGSDRSSAEIDQVAAALAAAQGDFGTVTKDKTADAGQYAYNYADLAAVLAAIRAPLKEADLSLSQDVVEDGASGVSVTTLLLHKSGQWLRWGPLTFPMGSNAQQAGSAISYARRYTIQAALGIAAEDDDAAAAVTVQPAAAPVERKKTSAPKGSVPLHTAAQLRKIHATATDAGVTAEQLHAHVLKQYGHDSLTDLTKAEAVALIDKLEKLATKPADDGGGQVGIAGADDGVEPVDPDDPTDVPAPDDMVAEPDASGA